MVSLPVSEQNGIYARRSALMKFILSYGVIQTHALNSGIYSLEKMSGGFALFVLWLEKNWLTASGLIIPAFFFLSGFSYFSGYSYEKTLDKWKRRVFTLVIPWVCWNTIMWAFYIVISRIPAIASRMNSDLNYEITFRSWLVDGLINSADGPMWFMLNLIVATILSPAIYALIKNRYVGALAIICGAAAAYITDASRYSLLVSTVFFAEAGYFSIHFRSLFLRRYSLPVRLCALGVLVLYMIFCSSAAFQHGGLYHVLAFSVTSPAIWVLLGDSEMHPFTKKVDRYRFWMYCSHYFPLECVEKVILITLGVSAAGALLDFVFAPIITMALLIGIGYPVRKYLPTLWAVLNGYVPPYRKKI